MVKKNNELRRLADMLTAEMHEKAEMIRNFNSSLFQFQTKKSHTEDIQNIQVKNNCAHALFFLRVPFIILTHNFVPLFFRSVPVISGTCPRT